MGVVQGGEIDSGERRVYSMSASRRIVVAISRSSTQTSYFPACTRRREEERGRVKQYSIEQTTI